MAWWNGWFGAIPPTGAVNDGRARSNNGRAAGGPAAVTMLATPPKSGAAKETVMSDEKPGGQQGGQRPALFQKEPTPDVSALNQQVVQAVQFSNTETANYAGNLVVTPPEIMVGQTAGMAVQDAKNYMNAIMQIAVAAQAVAIKKAAEGPQPVSTIKEIPFMEDIQNMVNQAVTVFGTVSTTAGSSAKTVISDLKSS